MGMVEKDFRLRIMVPGSTSAVALELTVDDFAALPQSGGALVDLARGRAPSQSFKFRVVDSSGKVSALLGDPATGRWAMLGRICEFLESTNGGAFATVYRGRLSALVDVDPPVYELTVSDERWYERRTEFFRIGDTTRLYPAGPIYQFRKIPRKATLATGKILEKTGDYLHFVLRNGGRLPAVTAEWIRQDVRRTKILDAPMGSGTSITSVSLRARTCTRWCSSERPSTMI